MQFLKQNTAATVLIGPAMDSSDAVTPETGLSTSVDELVLYKHDSTSVSNLNGVATMTHIAGGMYTVELASTDTNTLGRATLYLRDNDVCLPMWREFTVVPANSYDSLIGGTTWLDVDAVAVSGSTTAADAVEANIGNLDSSISGCSTFDPSTDQVVLASLSTTLSGQIADNVWDSHSSDHAGSTDTCGWLIDQLTGKVPAGTISDFDESTNTVVSSMSTLTITQIADITLRRNSTTLEGSTDGDTLSFRSLYGAIAKLTNMCESTGGTLKIYKANDTDTLGSQTITASSDADPITKLDTV